MPKQQSRIASFVKYRSRVRVSWLKEVMVVYLFENKSGPAAKYKAAGA